MLEKALLVIDLQNDYLWDKRKDEFTYDTETLVKNVNDAIIEYNENGYDIIYIPYTPKATVQAAIGTIPLSMGLECGSIVLTVAVLSILITAPFGAICVDNFYKKLLEKK